MKHETLEYIRKALKDNVDRKGYYLHKTEYSLQVALELAESADKKTAAKYKKQAESLKQQRAVQKESYDKAAAALAEFEAKEF